MRSPWFLRSTAGALLSVVAIYAVTAACADSLTAPCAQDLSKIQSRGLLDGVWNAQTVNNTPFAQYDIPFSDDVLEYGQIDFQTTYVAGDCDAPNSSSGWAAALYTYTKPTGERKVKSYLGRFTYNHQDKTIELSAAGYVVSGSTNGNVMTLPASHDIFGVNVSATVVLHR